MIKKKRHRSRSRPAPRLEQTETASVLEQTGAAFKYDKRLLVFAATCFAFIMVALLALLGARDKAEASVGNGEPVGTEIAIEDVETGITEDGFPYQGSPDAPVKFIEYSDYICGHCKDFALEKEPLLVRDYIATGKVQYIYHYYALKQTWLAEAVHCAADQGRFWEYHKLLFQDQSKLFGDIETLEQLQSVLNDIAERSGLDVPEFQACWNSHKHEQTIMDAITAAQEIGIEGTPTFSIQGQLIVGNQSYKTFQQAIEDALDEAGQ